MNRKPFAFALFSLLISSVAFAQSPEVETLTVSPDGLSTQVLRTEENSAGDPVDLDVTLESGEAGNVIKMMPGNGVVICPPLSCPKPPIAREYGHHSTSALFSADTQFGPEREENTVTILTTVDTGYAEDVWRPNYEYEVGDAYRDIPLGATYQVKTAGTSGPVKPFGVIEDNGITWQRIAFQTGNPVWAAGAPYASGARVNVPEIFATYEATVSGTSGASTPFNPTNFFQDYVDGSVVWEWIATPYVQAKVGLYNEQDLMPGAGKSWVQANNLDMSPGMVPSFNVNTEFDLTNRSGIDCGPGAAGCYNLFLVSQGLNRSTAQIGITSTPGGNVAPYKNVWGIRLDGNFLAENASIDIGSGGTYGLSFDAFGFTGVNNGIASIGDGNNSPRSYYNFGSHSVATIVDSAPGGTPSSLLLTGNRSGPTIADNTTSTTGATFSGVKEVAGVAINSTTPNGLLLLGNYADNQILGQNSFAVDASGVVKGVAFKPTGASTVAALPTCDAGTIRDQSRVVTDLNAIPVYYGNPVGGGAIRGKVTCNGSAWKFY